MRFVDSRRLTGPNLLADHALAVLDIALDGADHASVEQVWRAAVSRIAAALDWPEPETYRHDYRGADGGAISLAMRAPLDALYAATELNDRAWYEISGERVPDDEHQDASFADAIARIRTAAGDEHNPALLNLMRSAREHDCTLLWDDDQVSLGMGAHAGIWPVRELPDPATIDWAMYRDMPLGLVTGTNGKSTSARYASAILSAAGQCVGLSSTDWIRAGNEVLDRGDYSGPGGARAVLQHPKVDVAVLETARGGIKRRGLAVDRADVALITNIAEDHLGDFGVPDVASLLELKWIVSRVVSASGLLILNADDPMLVEQAIGYQGDIAWFGTDFGSEPLASAAASGLAASLTDGEMRLHVRGETTALLPAAEVAMSMDGLARHNLSNALGAALLSRQLGADASAIARGLREAEDADNPGRMGRYQIGGATLLIDFAHNPHGLEALFDVARALPAERRLLLIGQAGDRRDQDIRTLAAEAWALGLDRIIVKEMASYARGRSHGEVAGILRDAFLELGADEGMLGYCETELDGVREAIDWALAGDLAVLLIHEQIEDAVAELRTASQA
jgi:UDP-N-acetylmuramyl tripeptide synthase